MPEGELSGAQERKLQEERHQGARAKTLLEDPLLAAAFTGVRQEYIDAFVSAPLDDPKILSGLKMMLASLDRVKDHLTEHIDTGKLAVTRLGEIERKRRFWEGRRKSE